MHYHRNERDDFIRHLAEKFPRCFFERPDQRRPLKRDIIVDLDEQKVLNHETLLKTLDWYTNDFTYQYQLIAGAERVDLSGKKAGTVTPKEAVEARARVAARKREMAERHMVPTAPVVTRLIPRPTPTNAPPALAGLKSAVAVVGDLLTNDQYAPMRKVLAAAALKEVIATAEKMIGAMAE